MKSLTLLSPAKLNLYLRVVGKLPGGYHRLITLFHRISLCDTLRLERTAKGFSLTCTDPRLPTDSRNIVTQAYHLVKKRFPRLGGVSVHLTKRIPLGGGLAGGSSNAAAFLLGLRQLCDLPLSLKNLVSLGSELGSDVPFFLHNVKQALGEGRGDVITPVALRSRKWFVLILSERGLSTKLVYQSLPADLPGVPLTKAHRIARIACYFLEHADLFEVAKGLRNDLESPAIRLSPSIQKIIGDIVQLGIPSVAMSGSGPTVFALLSSHQQAEKLARRLRKTLSPKSVKVCHSF